MSIRKLANHIALYCSRDNTGYLMKYVDPDVLGQDQNYYSVLGPDQN
jgi:hypothetical protein